MREDGGPAFPGYKEDIVLRDERYEDIERPMGGMSLRDYFAGQALAGMLAKGTDGQFSKPEGVARAALWSYEYADAMLKERSK